MKGGLGNIMKQAQKMQENLQKAQTEIAAMEIDGEAGGDVYKRQVHISQICDERVQSVSDKLAVGDTVKVKVLEIDKQGRVRLSMKGLN